MRNICLGPGSTAAAGPVQRSGPRHRQLCSLEIGKAPGQYVVTLIIFIVINIIITTTVLVVVVVVLLLLLHLQKYKCQIAIR